MTQAHVSIRPLVADAEFQACLELQYETWGAGFREAVPPSILLVAQKIGGVAAGAFDARGKLLGFIFGLTGVRQGQLVHWSDMLAVRAEMQNAGIGRQLKDYQRRAAAAVGAKSVLWTFDPLQARNAHLNLNVFGARAVEYVANMYGEFTGSELHRGVGTDRLIMEWPVADEDLARQKAAIAAARGEPAFRDAPEIGHPEHPSLARYEEATHLRVVVPPDLAELLRTNPQRAIEWRQRNRAALQGALSRGFRIQGFVRAHGNRPPAYLLAR